MTVGASSEPDWVDTFDLWSNADHHADPYRHFEDLRSSCPVAHSANHGGYWIVANFETVSQVMRDWESFSNEQTTIPYIPSPMGPPIPIALDPPEHTAWRTLMNPVFAPGRVAEVEGVARTHYVEMLEGIKARGQCEFVVDFALEVPIQPILRLMGIPDSILPSLREWEAESLEYDRNLEAREHSVNVTRPKVSEFFRDVIKDRIETGPTGRDLISTLVSQQVGDRFATVEEMVRACVMILSAGLHTTAGSLSNMVLYLSRNPDVRDSLTGDPKAIPAAIEEMMRYEGLVTSARVARKDTYVGGKLIKKGESVWMFIGSALRDEERFEDADKVIIDRPQRGTMAFGLGPHRCIGSHLARMELRVAMEEIHRIIPDYRPMPGREVHRHTGVHRGVTNLWLLV
jgi:cytochrome P450